VLRLVGRLVDQADRRLQPFTAVGRTRPALARKIEQGHDVRQRRRPRGCDVAHVVRGLAQALDQGLDLRTRDRRIGRERRRSARNAGGLERLNLERGRRSAWLVGRAHARRLKQPHRIEPGSKVGAAGQGAWQQRCIRLADHFLAI
jgi:hypothetical protein